MLNTVVGRKLNKNLGKDHQGRSRRRWEVASARGLDTCTVTMIEAGRITFCPKL